MATKTLKPKTKAKPLGTFRPPPSDLDVQRMKLQGDKATAADMRRSITSGELQMTIEGASTLTVKVRDYTRALLNSALLQTEAYVNVDNIEYSLSKVTHTDNELTLIFEETAVHLLRKYKKPKKANRDNTTRAQFIRSMVTEVKERKIAFNCPEVNLKQPVGKSGAATALLERLRPSAGARGLTVKHAAASQHQLEMGKLIVETTRGRGGDAESCAGAVATAIQESGMTNMSGGDRDSQGLYQQRPSCGWGTVAQIRTPPYAIGKFLDKFLAFRKKGEGWLMASHHTQVSAFPNAPAQWYGEGQAFTAFFSGSGADSGSFATAGAGADSMTQVQPYEFSRGDANKPEDSWVCSGRLADEVQFRRYMSGGALWYVSDEWLIKQPIAYRVNEFTAGVVSLTFSSDVRTAAAEATLKVVSRRYSILPGDVIELTDEGTGSGLWLVSSIRRNLFSQVSDISLTRKRPKLPEPAPTTTTVSVGGSSQPTTAQGVVGPEQAQKAYQAGEAATAMNWVYSQPQRNDQRPGGHADCSSGVSWVLTQAGIPIPGSMKPNAPVSGSYESWGEAGPGKYFTIMCNGGHIWIRWNGIGPAWRFDTSGYGDSYTASSGGRNRTTPRPTTGFTQRHWSGL